MNKTLFFILLGLVGIPALLVVHGCGDEPAPKSSAAIDTPLPAATPVPLEWTTYTDDDLHFSFESPVTLDVTKPPAGLQAKTADMQGHSDGKDIYVRVQAQEVKYELDLAPEIDKQVKSLQSMTDALRNLQVTTNPVTIADAPGFLAEGTAHLPGRVPWEMRLLKVKKDSTLLDMFIQFSPTPEGKAMAQKMVDSLAFSN